MTWRGEFANRGKPTPGAASNVSRFVKRLRAGDHVTPPRDLGRFALIFLAFGLVFGWLGPYGTYQLAPLPRFAYWLIGIQVIGMMAIGCMTLLRRTGRLGGWPLPAQAAVGALLTALPGSLVAIGLRYVFATPPAFTAAALLQIYVSVSVIALLVAVPMSVILSGRRAAPSDLDAAPDAEGSPFLRRIPEKLGTDLLSIATEDHYLRVTTERGSDLILLRLSDALAELDAGAGLRVHRSYWVARRAVASVERNGHRTVLRLLDGTEIPVSRSYLGALREAGWLES